MRLHPLARLLVPAFPWALAALAAAAPDGRPAAAGALDAAFFEDAVQPLLGASCATAGCHGARDGAGDLRLLPRPAGRPYSAEATRANLEAVSAFVAAGRPRESVLWRKVVPLAEGGLPHAAARPVAAAAPLAKAIERFASGESVAEPKPVADAGSDRAAKVGSRVALDGTKSRNRTPGPLAFRWSFEARPAGSAAAFDDPVAARPAFSPDLAGAYVARLEVRGPAGISPPDTVRVVADATPIVLVEAEDGTLSGTAIAVADPAASGGAAVATEFAEGEASAECEFFFPAAADVGVWADVRGAGSTRAFFEAAIDGAPAAPIKADASRTFRLSPATAVSGLRLKIAAGEWREEDLGVVGTAAGETLAACTIASPLPSGSVSAVVGLERTPGPSGSIPGAFLVFDSRSSRDYRAVGVERGGESVLLTRVAGGAEERVRSLKLAAPLAPGFHHFRLRLGSEKLVFAIDGETVFEEPARGGFRGGAGLGVRGGSVRFEEVSVRRAKAGAESDAAASGGALVADSFGTSAPPDLLSLAPGAHRLKITFAGPGSAVDRVLVAPRDAALDLPDDERRFIRRVHFDLLGRPPSESELLVAAAEGRDAAVSRLLASEEFAAEWYEGELYYFLLIDHFRPASGRFSSLPRRLERGEITFPDAVREIVSSQSFAARNPGPDTFVTVVLEQLNGLRVQDEPKTLEAGKRLYDGYEGTLFGRKGRSQSDVVKIAAGEPSFRKRFVERLAALFFDEPLPPAERDAAAERLSADPDATREIAAGWILSERYAASAAARARKKTDRQYVRSLYADLVRRSPTYEEMRDLRNAFQSLADAEPLRAVVARLVCDSRKAVFPQPEKEAIGDPERFVRGEFARLLGRQPTAAEASAFAAAWADPACTPRAVVKALVTLPEYQTY